MKSSLISTPPTHNGYLHRVDHVSLATVHGRGTKAWPTLVLRLLSFLSSLSHFFLPLIDHLSYMFYGIQTLFLGPNSPPIREMIGKDAVVITGCGSGIGYETAIELASRNIIVYAGVHKQEQANRLRRLNLPSLVPIQLDVTNHASLAAARDSISHDLARRGSDCHLMAICNIAGVATSAAMDQATGEEIYNVFNTNVLGPVAVTQTFLPLIRRHSLGGRILLVGAISSTAVTPHAGVYCGSKAAVERMFEAMRMELVHENIHVAIIRPGGVATGIHNKFPIDDREHGQAFAKFAHIISDHAGIPIQDAVRPIHHALTSVCPLLSYVTGLDSRLVSIFQAIVPRRVYDTVVNLIFLGHI